MATAKFEISQVGITDYLILRARKVSDPLTETDRYTIGPAPATVNNYIFNALDPETYFFDLYESVDGTALSHLFGTLTYDAANNKVTNEKRFYVVGRGLTGDPVDKDTTLTDAYFDGKNVVSVFQRGTGFLLPTVEWTMAGTTISLHNSIQFSDAEVWCVEIDYTMPDTTAQSLTFFSGIKTVTANTTLDNTYRNNRIKCNGTGAQLVITLEAIAGIPNGKFFYFVDQEGGAQKQTKIVTPDGNFKWNGNTTTEIWLGKGEKLWIEKQGSSFDVVDPPAGLLDVGLIVTGAINPMPNTLAEDNSLYNADDYPRLWYWLTHALIPNLYVLDDTLDNVGYTRPAIKPGQFIVSTTKRKFRMPDTREMTQKGLMDFTTYNTDTSRLFDYPGGLQGQQVGEITVPLDKGDGYSGHSATPKRFAPGQASNPQGTDNIVVNTGKANLIDNVGVIFLRRA